MSATFSATLSLSAAVEMSALGIACRVGVWVGGWRVVITALNPDSEDDGEGEGDSEEDGEAEGGGARLRVAQVMTRDGE